MLLLARRGAVILMMFVAACANRGTVTIVPPETPTGPVAQVFVGTTRAWEGGSFGTARSEAMRFARYDIAVPPRRELGEIRFPPKHGKPDPATDFVATAVQIYGQEPQFRSDLSRALAANGGEAVIFVHGFNNTFAEGLYRIAQLKHDLQVPGVMVHYSWASAAEPLGYVYDRDSMMFARSGLESLIRQVSAAGARRIVLIGHSMGGFLTVETLRQMSIRDDGLINRVSSVVLISPDIDVEVFHQQAREIGHLPQPFVIFGSERDRALQLSALITGQQDRLGNLDDVTPLADLPVTYLDVTAFSKGGGHFVPGTSPALIRILSKIADVTAAYGSDATTQPGLLPGVVLTAQGATRIILSPVAGMTVGQLN